MLGRMDDRPAVGGAGGMSEATLVIRGEPVAAARARATSIAGKPRVFTPKANTAYVDQVRMAWKDRPMLEGDIAVEIICRFSRPKSHFGTGRNAGILKPSAPRYRSSKPDCDNLAKLICDGLNGFAYRDDAQVVSLSVVKAYADVGSSPMTIVTLRALPQTS